MKNNKKILIVTFLINIIGAIFNWGLSYHQTEFKKDIEKECKDIISNNIKLLTKYEKDSTGNFYTTNIKHHYYDEITVRVLENGYDIVLWAKRDNQLSNFEWKFYFNDYQLNISRDYAIGTKKRDNGLYELLIKLDKQIK